MARPGIEVSGWDVRWTGEDLSESYEELAELEPLGEGPPEEATPERVELELVSTLEARGTERPPPRGAAAAPAPGGRPTEDAETYAVLPELEVLLSLADYGRALLAREDANDESAEARLLV